VVCIRRRDRYDGYVPRVQLAPALLTLVAVLGTSAARADPPEAPATSWATTQAAERTRAGHAHAASGEHDAALRSYLDALGFDVTYAPAYLALGELYEARGDVGEADRALSMGIEHVAGFYEALVGRARLRARLHRSADAIADLEAAAALRPEGPGVLRELASAYVAAGALPAALAVTRRRVVAAEALGDDRAAREARVEVKALAGLVGEVDPVMAGKTSRGVVRRALWTVDRKR
jgi:tetratricopeptide (TPR) repeat protein